MSASSTLKNQPKTELPWYSSAPLMISVSFGMFTAVWQYVANECRVATMQEEGVIESEREKKRDTESWCEGGGEWAVFMVQHTD